MRFKKLRDATWSFVKEMWIVPFLICGFIAFFILGQNLYSDATLTIWVSKSILTLNIGDLLIILLIAYLLFKK